MSSPHVEAHLFAAARAAAGTSVLTVASGTLAEVLNSLIALAPDLAEVLPRCSYLVDGLSVRASETHTPVAPGSRIDVLPPFAGG